MEGSAHGSASQSRRSWARKMILPIIAIAVTAGLCTAVIVAFAEEKGASLSLSLSLSLFLSLSLYLSLSLTFLVHALAVCVYFVAACPSLTCMRTRTIHSRSRAHTRPLSLRLSLSLYGPPYTPNVPTTPYNTPFIRNRTPYYSAMPWNAHLCTHTTSACTKVGSALAPSQVGMRT